MLCNVDIVYKNLSEKHMTVEVSKIEELDDIVQSLLTDDVNYVIGSNQDDSDIIQWTFEARSDVVRDNNCCLF